MRINIKMKKTLSVIGMLFMISDAAFAAKSIPIDLNTPVRWHSHSIINAFVHMVDKAHGNFDAALDMADDFEQTMTITDLTITISPAEIVEKCMSVYHNKKAKNRCTDMVVDAIDRHNDIVNRYSSTGIASMDDMATKIKWDVWELLAALNNAPKGHSGNANISRTLANDYFDDFSNWMDSVNYVASLNEWVEKCEIFSEKTFTTIIYDKPTTGTRKSWGQNPTGWSCQNIIRNLVKIHNDYVLYFSLEKLIK